MEIIVKKNSSKTITLPVTDIADWADCLQSAVVTFSMLDVSTGCYVVANRPANFRLGVGDDGGTDNCEIDGVTLVYELSPRQTKNKGVFRGEFRVDFLSNGVEETLVYPASDHLDIVIVDSITTTNKSAPKAGLPVLLPPSDADCCVFQIEVSKLEFENLAKNGNLKPGVTYGVRMGFDIILVVTAATTHDIMPFGQLLNNGIPSTDAIKTNIEEDLLIFSVFTGGTPPIIRGGSAREADFPSDARYVYK